MEENWGEGRSKAVPCLDEGYFHNAVIAFFLYALNLLDVVKEECREEGEARISCSEQCLHITAESSFSSEKILDILLDYCQKDSARLTVNGKFVSPNPNGQENEKVKYFVHACIEEDIQAVERIIQHVDVLFVDEKVKAEAVAKLQKLKEFYQQRNNKKSKEKLWNRATICDFLDQYYDILSYVVCENDILKADGVRENVLKPILSLGVRTAEDGTLYAEMMAPLVLSAMHLIYDRLDDYFRLSYTSELKDLEKMVYHEIFLAKIFQIFRFTLVGKDSDELCHAALPAYQKEPEKKAAELKVPIRYLSTYNSYQGIRELRLGEKITFEIEDMLQQDRKTDAAQIPRDRYCIILIGDVARDPLKELIVYVEKRLGRSQKEIGYEIYSKWKAKLEYIIYTVHDDLDYDHWESVGERSCYQFRNETNILQSSDCLKRVMDEGNLIFYLDYRQLYRTEIQPIRNYLIFRQSYALDSYRNFYDGIKTNDMFLKCKYTELYQILTAYVWKGQLGTLKKYAREDVLGYIKKYIMDSHLKTAYLYISDIDAFKQLHCVQEHMVRIEKYNQKQIGIVRFAGNDQAESLPVRWIAGSGVTTVTVQCLRFNLWQFVKHNVLNKKREFNNIFQEGDFYNGVWLNEVYISIDYSNWREKLRVSWSMETTEKEDKFCLEKLEIFVRDFFDKPIKNQNENMYNHYLKNAYVSFLFGNAKSVEDLVFLHILKRKPESIGEIEIIGFKKDEVKYPSGSCRYSRKKIFWEVIEEMDQSAPSLMGEYAVLKKVKQDYTKEIGREEDDAVEECLSHVLQACEGVGYKASALYTNCTVNLGKNNYY